MRRIIGGFAILFGALIVTLRKSRMSPFWPPRFTLGSEMTRLIALVVVTLFVVPACADDPHRTDRRDLWNVVEPRDRVREILAVVTRANDNSSYIEVFNSRVIVKTPGIDSVVARGLSAVPLLAEAMRDEKLSFGGQIDGFGSAQ